MTRPIILVLSVVTLAAAGLRLSAAPQITAEGDKLLAAAKHKAVDDGDLPAAIEMYQRIVSSAGTNRALAANALLGLAECYDTLGKPEARETYERIVREFELITAVSAVARARVGQVGVGPLTRKICGGPGCRFEGSSISRDGRWMASGAGSLVVQDMKTGGRTTLVASVPNALGDVETALISPDGRRVAFTWCCDTVTADRSSLRLISNRDGATPRTLLPSQGGTWPRAVAWSRDGNRILAIVGKEDWSSQLVWVPIAGGAPIVVITRSPESPLHDASVSPDGRFIVFSTGPQRSSERAARQLYANRVDLRAEQFARVPVLDNLRWRGPLTLSPDGRVAYVFRKQSGQPARIMAIDLASGAERPVFTVPAPPTAGPSAIASSPDGLTLAIAWHEGGESTAVATVSLDGGGYREIGRYSPGPIVGQLWWTRDGRALLFSRAPDGQCRLMRINVAGGPAEFTGVQVESPAVCTLAVNPVNGRIALGVSEGASELWTIDVSEAALLRKGR